MTSHDSFSQYFHFSVQSQQLRRATWVVVIFFATTYSSFAQSSLKELSKQMDSAFSGIASHDTPGFAVLVKKDAKIVFEKGYGVRDLRTKTASRANKWLASFTNNSPQWRCFEHDGKLRYDQTLTDISRNFAHENHHVRNLPNHTGGLPDYEDLMDAAQKQQASLVGGNKSRRGSR
jgi:CubicO group peptidase (beta-lactamase class C family)